MLAGWPGMGNVGVGAVNYLRENLDATLFAEIESGPLWTPEAVVVEDGIAKIPVIPPSRFYHTTDPAMIIFEGSFQPGGRIGDEVGREIIDLAARFKVRMIYTGAAFAMPISYRESSQVYGVVNREFLRDQLQHYTVEIMKEGQISGMNGLILALAAQHNIDAMCLLATLPQYAINFPNPKASRAIIEILESMLQRVIDKKELDKAVSGMDQKLGLIEQKIKETFYQMEKDDEEEEVEDDQVPGYVMEKIEKLFGEVKQDRSKAPVLKDELDRWNLYELYEDRFLDLFRD
jgi:predicted ATP-grasp superfamily ATP-dependent carboligase